MDRPLIPFSYSYPKRGLHFLIFARSPFVPTFALPVSFTLNGQPCSFDVDPAMPLLWVIRERAELTGTKFGCGMGLCGSCTVHLNGAPIRSCITPVADASDQVITTIEGIAGSASARHAVQQAWIDENVPQCGYCQSGQIMSAVALLAANPQPSDADIDAALTGNICRCGTYPRIRRGIHRAAAALRSQREAYRG